MKRTIWTLILLWCGHIFTVNAQQNIAFNPPMGFNSYTCYNNSLSQEIAIKLIDVLAEKYKPLGYDYFVIDLGWYTEEDKLHIDKYGYPEPSRVFFSNGIKALCDYAHSKDIKLGLHLMRGVLRQAITDGSMVKGTNIPIQEIVNSESICTWCGFTIGVDMNKKGAQEYYDGLMQKMADWGVDFIKYDDITGMPDELLAISKAIKKTGRPILLSLSPGEDTKMEYVPYYKNSNMLRVTADIWDNQSSIDRSFDAMKVYQGMGMPGFWPDLDMIPLGRLEVLKTGQEFDNRARKSKFTKDQAESFITQRSIFASPLFIGGDLLTMDAHSDALLTNKRMIECNQNGVSGSLVYMSDSLEIYKAVNKNDTDRGWLAIFNRSKKTQNKKLGKTDLGFSFNRPILNILIPNYHLFDIWNEKDYYLKTDIELSIPSNGVAFFEFTKINKK